MTRQGSVEAPTFGGDDASLLAQQFYGRLTLADYLRMAVRVHLAIILSADDGLRVLGTFAFVTSQLFSLGRHQSSSVAKLLCLIDRM